MLTAYFLPAAIMEQKYECRSLCASEREELEVMKERLSNRQLQQPFVQDVVEAQRKEG